MREIKFRGKNQQGKWIIGEILSLNKHKYIAPQDGDWFDFIPWVDNNVFHAPDSDEYEVKQDTIGQYTGLHDKNGKEIYEGDIILHHASNGEPMEHQVYYLDKEARFATKLIGYDFLDEGELTQRWLDEVGFEVIGNVHDNPELLKTE